LANNGSGANAPRMSSVDFFSNGTFFISLLLKKIFYINMLHLAAGEHTEESFVEWLRSVTSE
jgi:hypothetical protein